MAESADAGLITVTLVWSDNDWPEPPLSGGQPAYDLPAASSIPDAPQLPILYSRRCRLAAGQSLADALVGLLTDSARNEIRSGKRGVSVFGRKPRQDQPVYDGDRIELLGHITADPKSERRDRVKADRARGGRSPWSRQQGNK